MIYYKLKILNKEYNAKTVLELVCLINEIIVRNGINSNLITHHIITRMVCKNIKSKKWDFLNIVKFNSKNLSLSDQPDILN
jgi:hypothetical protein